MQGQVVSLIRPGQHGDVGHPNAVVLHLSGDQFLCVAGFTPDQHKYNEARRAEFKLGIWENEFAVEIDHARYLSPTAQAPADLHVCGYIFQTAEIMSIAQLHRGRNWGPLDPGQMRRIVDGLLAREAKRPYLAKNVVKLLKQY